MLPRPYRLQDRQVFPQVYAQGKRRSGTGLSLIYLPQPSQLQEQPSQFAVVVSKKVSRKATVRNRIRRQVQAILYPVLDQVRTGYWIIVSARSPILSCPWLQLQQEVIQLLRRARLLQDSPGDHRFGQAEVGSAVR